MPRVIVAPSALNASLIEVRHFDGDVEAFVRSEYPNVKRWQFTTDGDDHYAVGVFGLEALAAAIAAINWYSVAASVVLAFVANKLIGKPKATNRTNEAASPTYNIGTGQNQARLGAVIPSVYGTVTMLPDYAAQPYTEFVHNEQYLRAIYCLGHGEVDVHKMIIGETDSAALPDVVSWKVFKPADHNQTFGTIEGATGIGENIFTNSEVADQLLEGEKDRVGDPAQWHWAIRWYWDPSTARPPVVHDIPTMKAMPQPATGTMAWFQGQDVVLPEIPADWHWALVWYWDPATTRPPTIDVATAKAMAKPAIGTVQWIDDGVGVFYAVATEGPAAPGTPETINGAIIPAPVRLGATTNIYYAEAVEGAATPGTAENVIGGALIPNPVAPVGPADWHWSIVARKAPDYYYTVELESSRPTYPGFNEPTYSRQELSVQAKPNLGTTRIYHSGGDVWFTVVATNGPSPAGAPADAVGGAVPVNDQTLRIYTVVGPFNMCKPDQTGTDAYVDIVFAGGLFRQDPATGALQNQSVELKFSFTPIDRDGNVPSGAVPIDFNRTLTAKTNTPQRHTLHFPLPTGRYRCSATRITQAATDTNISDQVTWTGLKFRLSRPTHSVYGDTTLVAVSIKATNGVSSGSSSRVRFRCSRKLNVLDGTGKVYTHNPVDALIDILTAPYGGRRPMTADELDLDEMRRARTKWANHNGFNAIFDKPTTVWEAMASALQPVAAVPLPQGSRISIAHDCVKDYRVALFTDENIVSGSLAISYDFDKIGDPAATRVEYRTAEWFDPAYVTEPPNREDVETINLFGCTSENVAKQHAVLANNRRKMRRKSITFETELEGLLVTHGQRIGVTHSTPKWGHSAQVLSVSGRTLTLSVAPDWTLPDLSVLIRDTEGRPHQMRGVTRGANDYALVLPSDPAFSIPTIDGGYEGAIIAIGTYNREVTDWVVMSMEPSGEQRVKITASEYRAEVYTGTMPHQLVDASVAP